MSAPDYEATYHDVDVPRNTIQAIGPLSQGERLLRCGALYGTRHYVQMTLFSCNERRPLKMNVVIVTGNGNIFEIAIKPDVIMVSRNNHFRVSVMTMVMRLGRAADPNVVVVARNNHFLGPIVVIVVVVVVVVR